MIEVLYFSVALIAVAFTFLVIYVNKMLNSVKRTLDSVSQTLTGLEKQLQGVASETEELLHKTNILMDDLQKKSESINTVVKSFVEVGETVNRLNGSFRKIVDQVDKCAKQKNDAVIETVKWSTAVIDIWKRIKENKSKKIGGV
ncbi:DUF948 domain-containing protein [Calidifontibacillus erzurumensis]|uniref:DUF948 domain-containing protein n=1 Tax=Calidifontibacillus erzurumensis TaxID=2741433 RepID=A0A8J8KE19_9BACI|nr:DUF948 domain-containing protein [Calidifontibacillus erzurumensis]NSL51325.1 DUF948 domain-containing protein [Calidifontibacillus erzurumensis]